jgi:hypothetical protein
MPDLVGKTFTTIRKSPPGIVTGAAYADLDALGLSFFFDVPKSGIIISANYFDLDDEGLQVDLWLLREEPTLQTDNGAMVFQDGDILKVIKRLQFTAFGDANLCQTSELDNIGRAYSAPSRRIWAQAQARGALNIAVLNMPMFSLTILPDPD